MNTPKSPGRRRLSALVLILVGFFLALLLVEGLVRVFFDEPVQPRFVVDPGYGVRGNQANVTTRHYVPGEYSVKISTNSAGMRGQREYPVERTYGVGRVLILGDSFSFGFGVEDDEVVSAVLEDQLNEQASTGSSYEVVNLSVSGFGQAEELVTYRELGRKYAADFVILFYFSNDIGNNAVSKLFKLSDDGQIVRTQNTYLPAVKTREWLYRFAPIRWLFTYSEAWNLIRNRLSSIVQKSKLREQGLKTFKSTKPEAVALTEGLLTQFILDTRADRAVPIIFVIPGKRVESNFPLSAEAWKDPAIFIVDGRHFLVTDDYYARDAHWRASGHKKAAEQLTELILAIQ